MGNEVGRKTKTRRIVYFASVLFLFVLYILSPIGQAQASQELQTDAVYLLDVTSSMVGQDIGAKDILNDVIDLLLADIDQFHTGKFILITFAVGPFDLDGVGLIKARYELEIKTDQDKLFLKQFLRPYDYEANGKQYKGYGAFPNDPSWHGVYHAVKSASPGIGPTAIYSTVLQGLERLEQLQSAGGKEYAATHAQKIFVYTDGRNNAVPSPSFDEVLKNLSDRHFKMMSHFGFKRYLFSRDPEDLKQVTAECNAIDQASALDYVQNVAAPDPSQLVILDFDRNVLGFPNLWAQAGLDDKRTLVLKNIQVRYDQAKAPILQGGRLILALMKPGDFGLPGDIAIQVRTDPANLVFPLTQFDLYITISPFSRLKPFMDEGHKEGLRGALEFAFIKGSEVPSASSAQAACNIAGGKEPLIDLKQSAVSVDLPYVRPTLQAKWRVVPGEAFALALMPTGIFSALSADDQIIRVDYDDQQLTLVDDNGRTHKPGEPFSLQGLQNLSLKARDDLVPGLYKGSVRLTSALSETKINGADVFEQSYQFNVMGFDRQKLVFPNLWVRQSDVAGDVRMLTAELQLVGGPADQGQISVKPVDFGLAQAGIGIDVVPKTLQPPFDRRTIQLTLTVKLYSLLSGKEDLQTQLNQNEIDGYLLFEVAAPQGQLVKIAPSRLPVDLSYRVYRPEVELTVNGQTPASSVLDLGTLGKDQAALTLDFKANETFNDLAGSQQMVKLDYNVAHFYLVEASGHQVTAHEINPVQTAQLVLRVNPALPADDRPYQGTVAISSAVQGLRVGGHERSLTITYRFLRLAPQVFIAAIRSNRNLGMIQGDQWVDTFKLDPLPNEAYAKVQTPIKIEYSESLFTISNSRNSPIQSGSSIMEQMPLQVRVNPKLRVGALSYDEIATVQFTSSGDVKINGKATETFRYVARVQGWLSKVLNGLKWFLFGALILLTIALIVYSVIEGDPPWSLIWSWIQQTRGATLLILALIGLGYLALMGLVFGFAGRI